jgi:hypothetical protein
VSLSVSFFSDPYEVMSTRAFYSSSSASYNESQGPIGGLGAGKTLAVGCQWSEVANDVYNSVGTSSLVAGSTALGQ